MAPSLCYEVFPLIAAEALAHGTPVIARRIGALTEVIEETGAGCLFETVEECRAGMDRLIADPALRNEMGQRGRAMVLEKWTVDVHLAHYLDIVHSTLSTRTAQA